MMGVETIHIETDENGKVSSNARLVADAIKRAQDDKRKVLLVSASKGSAEVALALGELLEPEQTTHVKGWISLCGVVQGTPFVDRWLEPDRRWATQVSLQTEGFDLGGVPSMAATVRRARFANLKLPEHVVVVSYVPLPLSGDVSSRASFLYSELRSHGPNDGLTLLADQVIPGSLTLIEPGVDHYFGHPDKALRALAVLTTALDEMEVEQVDVVESPVATDSALKMIARVSR